MKVSTIDIDEYGKFRLDFASHYMDSRLLLWKVWRRQDKVTYFFRWKWLANLVFRFV